MYLRIVRYRDALNCICCHTLMSGRVRYCWRDDYFAARALPSLTNKLMEGAYVPLDEIRADEVTLGPMGKFSALCDFNIFVERCKNESPDFPIFFKRIINRGDSLLRSVETIASRYAPPVPSRRRASSRRVPAIPATTTTTTTTGINSANELCVQKLVNLSM